MQDFNPLRPTELISSSRSTINNNMESVASHFSGTYFPTSNLVAGMYCWRTDLNKMYQLNADLVNWTLVNDMSQGYNSVAHANRADYATKDANGNDIATTYSKQAETDNIILRCYPVGSIYMSVNSTDPATLFGGSWQQLAGGRVLMGQDSSHQAGTTGGSETQSITLSTNNLPSHNHIAYSSGSGSHNHTGTTSTNGSHTHSINSTDAAGSTTNWCSQASYNVTRASLGTNSAGNHNHTFTTSTISDHTHNITVNNTGNGQAFSISHIQPYLSVYMWKRVA